MSESISVVVERLKKDLLYMQSGRVVSFSGAGKIRLENDLAMLLQHAAKYVPGPAKPVELGAKSVESEKIEVPASKEKKVRARNPLMDALALVEGHVLSDMTENAWKRIGVALQQIRMASPNVTPEEIARRAVNYRKKYPTRELTANSLASWWGACGDAANVKITSTKIPDNMRAR